MKLLKPTWVNHNGECAQVSRKVEPGVESESGVGSEPRAGPARLAPDAPGARCPNCGVGGSGLCPPPGEAGEHGHVLRLSSANPPSLLALALSPRSPTRGPWRSRGLPPGSGPGRQPAPATRLQQPGCAQMVQRVKLGPGPLRGFSVAGRTPEICMSLPGWWGRNCSCQRPESSDSAPIWATMGRSSRSPS